MTESPYDDAAEATAEWARYRAEGALALWREQMPERLRVASGLLPAVAMWAERLAAGHRRSLCSPARSAAARRGRRSTPLRPRLSRLVANPAFTDAAGWRDAIGQPPDEVTLSVSASAGAWVLDDPGAIRLGAWDLEHLYAVVNHRWARGLPIVLTSNVANLRELLGERIASRLADRRDAGCRRG